MSGFVLFALSQGSMHSGTPKRGVRRRNRVFQIVKGTAGAVVSLDVEANRDGDVGADMGPGANN